MLPTPRRTNQPEQLKAALLAAAMDLLVDSGFQSVTLEAVARKAKVSKGGLLHHFRNKGALLDALTQLLFDQFHEKYELAVQQEPPGAVQHLRAFVRVCFAMLDARPARALGLLNLFWPSCTAQCERLLSGLVLQDAPDARLGARMLLVRLAGEGFWYANMQGFYDLTEQRRILLCDELLRMCDDLE